MQKIDVMEGFNLFLHLLRVHAHCGQAIAFYVYVASDAPTILQRRMQMHEFPAVLFTSSVRMFDAVGVICIFL
jgi:hypothetical protein